MNKSEEVIYKQTALDAIGKMQIPIMRSKSETDQLIFKGLGMAWNAIDELDPAQIDISERRMKKMAEFIGVEEKAINVGDPLIFENKTDCSYDVSVGIVFHKSGIYKVSIDGNKTTITTVSNEKLV